MVADQVAADNIELQRLPLKLQCMKLDNVMCKYQEIVWANSK